jgi:hypothetical protein
MSLYLSNHVCYPLCALVLQSTRMKTRHCLTPSQAVSQEEDRWVSSSSCFCVGLRRSHERKPSFSRRSSLPSAGAMALSAWPHLIRLRRGWVIGLAGDHCSFTFHHHCFSFSFSRSFVCEVELMSHTDTRAQQPTLTPVRPALHCPALPRPARRRAPPCCRYFYAIAAALLFVPGPAVISLVRWAEQGSRTPVATRMFRKVVIANVSSAIALLMIVLEIALFPGVSEGHKLA